VLPAGAGEPPHPCLLLLHGRGTNESDLLPLGPEIDGRLFTVGARGPFRFPWGGYAWYDLDPRGVGFPEEETLERSVQVLRQFLTEIVDAYPVDPARLYVGGFSMGSVMAGTLALTDPERVAGAVILSGYLPIHNTLELHPERAAGHPIFEGHGVHDDVIPVSFGREARDFLAGTPVSLTYREYPMGHQVAAEEVDDLRSWMAGVLESDSSTDAPSRP
jgi:phospholipase/carboxylesterase